MLDDYRCPECGYIEVYVKKHGESFPETIKMECRNCTGTHEFKRVWDNKGKVFQVAEGLHGNASNGYSSNNSTYMPAGLTPLNKVYGNYGRSMGVEGDHE